MLQQTQTKAFVIFQSSDKLKISLNIKNRNELSVNRTVKYIQCSSKKKQKNKSSPAAALLNFINLNNLYKEWTYKMTLSVFLKDD